MSRPEDSIHAPAHFAAKANMRHRDYARDYEASINDPDAFSAAGSDIGSHVEKLFGANRIPPDLIEEAQQPRVLRVKARGR